MERITESLLPSKSDIDLLAKLSSEISLIIQRDAQSQAGRQEKKRYQNKLLMDTSLIGISVKTLDLIRTLEKYAQYDSTVLILGETGTGKNLIAELIHQNSLRRNNLFLEVNCAAIPEQILESEMFGVVKHYPGFHNPEALLGKFQLAEKGTLFLNEIGELPLRLQPKLLQAIEAKQIWPIGATEPVQADIRIITATNRDLESEIRQGKFRIDLFERLNIISIEVPPLRERKEDIMILAGYFLFKLRQKYAKRLDGFSVDCADFLGKYNWRGNVRELNAAVERAVVNTEDDIIRPEHFGLKNSLGIEPVPLSEMERSHIIRVLEYTKGKKEAACKILKISKQTLYNKGKEYKLPGFI